MKETVREIAAKTRVQPSKFKKCPNGCGATIQDDFEINEVTIPTVYAYCRRCNKCIDLDSWKVNDSIESVEAKEIFRRVVA